MSISLICLASELKCSSRFPRHLSLIMGTTSLILPLFQNSHKESQSRLRFLYWYVTTRGPKAFSQLCEVLKETGNGVLVTFLLGER